MLEPRKYQIEAVEAVLEAQKRGVSRQLVSLPTGTGKTIIFALLAKRLGVRTLILAHREELLQQAKQKLHLVWPEAAKSTGILRAKKTDGLLSEVCIASVQTAVQPKRLTALKSRNFGLLIIDEAHHATADSYYKIAGELGFLQPPALRATPFPEGGLETRDSSAPFVKGVPVGRGFSVPISP